MVAATVEIDSALMDAIHQQILRIDRQLTEQVKCHDPVARQLLQTVPGIGPTLALVILYEIGDIARFPRVGNFISYARLVKCAHESARKRVTGANNKVGNAHLKWAFSEATVLSLRGNSCAQRYHEKLVSKCGKAEALSIIAQKLGRVVYSILKQRSAFDPKRFYQ
jgi:transposase